MSLKQISWHRRDLLAVARGIPGMVAVENRVYLVGGNKAPGAIATVNYTADVDMAILEADGTLGPWRTVGNLPTKRVESAVLVHGDIMYVLGNFNTAGASPLCWYARINSDGTLGRFLAMDPFPIALGRCQAVISKGYLFVLDSVSVVYRSRLGADGAPGPWIRTPQGPSYPTATWNRPSLSEHNGRLILAGGLEGSTVTQAVRMATVDSDGNLSEWKTIGSLSSPRWRHWSVVVGDEILFAGGTTTSSAASAVSTVEVASLGPDGSLGAVTVVDGLPASQYSTRVVRARGWLLVLGGRAPTTGNALDVVYAARVE